MNAAPAPELIEAAGLAALPAGVVLIGICLAVHSMFMFMILTSHAAFVTACPGLRGARMLVPSILLATALITVSCFIQVSLWAGLLWWTGEFERAPDAMHFSATTFTTLGTSRHALSTAYRVLEPLEATNGLLANGLNTAILFAVMSSLARRRSGYEDFFH